MLKGVSLDTYIPSCLFSYLLSTIYMRGIFKHTTLKSNNETSFSVYLKGSFTVEAAVIIPCFATFMLFFLFLFRVLSVQEAVQEALVKTAKEVAAFDYKEEEGKRADEVLLAGEATVVFLKNINENKSISSYISGGITLINSSFGADNIELVADYKMKLPIQILGTITWKVSAKAVSRKWIGNISLEHADKNNDEYVFVTPNGVAYHMKTDCPYLDLTVRAVEKNKVGSLRNKNKHKYYKCEGCKNSLNGMVFVTDYGDRYHGELSCSGLKRTINTVSITEVGKRHACPKCAA